MSKNLTENPGDNVARTTDLVTELTKVLLKGGENASNHSKKVDNMVQYSLRILGSRMYPSMEKDEEKIAQKIRKKLNKTTEGDSQESQHFEDLFIKFQQQENPKQKWSVLYLLYSLSGEGQKNTFVDSIRHQTYTMSERISNIETHSSMIQVVEKKAPSPSVKPNRHPISIQSLKENARVLSDIPEEQLLRDLIFVLQDIPGELIVFNKQLQQYTVRENVGLPSPVQNLVSRIAELGWMYRRVCEYVNNTLEKDSVELIEQSFCSALQQELTDYYRLIAVLESQINESNDLSKGKNTNGKEELSGRFTLRRFYIWIQDPLERLRLMAMITDSVKGLKGGALASAVGSHMQHGDPFVQSFVRRLMHQLCQPIFHMVERWVTVGELKDPFEEFFVAANPNVPMDRFWQERYTLRKAMIPSFIDEKLAETILVTGKSINFIRDRCQDAEWITEFNFTFNQVLPQDSEKQSVFEKEINEAAKATNTRLMELLTVDYKLKDHCGALKKYLLLSQGDFIQNLLDNVHTELDKKASELHEHSLRGFLMSAIQKSNVQYHDDYIKDRLDVKVMAPSDGDCGWEVFSLNYRIDPPLDVVFTSDAMEAYLQIFNFLWRVKRVEHILTGTWMRHTHQAHVLHDRPNLRALCHKSYLIRSEMTHFVRNLHSYMMFEVIECAWKDLCDGLDAAKNLDDVLRAHNAYLNEIKEKALLGGEKSKLFKHLQGLFKMIIRLGHIQKNRFYDKIFGEEYVRKLRAKGKKKARLDIGVIDNQLIESTDSMMCAMERKYREGVNEFFVMLNGRTQDRHKNADVNNDISISGEHLGFLSYRLDFNEFYGKSQGQNKKARRRRTNR